MIHKNLQKSHIHLIKVLKIYYNTWRVKNTELTVMICESRQRFFGPTCTKSRQHYAESLRLSSANHIFFWITSTISVSSESELASAFATATECQCNAVKYFLINFTTGCLSRIITKPVGLSIRSISMRRSSALQPFFSRSEKTVHA